MNFSSTNLSLLQQRDPVLAARVANDPQDAQVVLQITPSGMPTAVVQAMGQRIALHHPGDPAGQTREFLDSMPGWKKARNTAVLGGGLGYAPLWILQAQPKLRNLVVLEPSLTVFRAALQAVDLSPLLSDRRVRFIVGSQPGAIYSTLMQSVIEFIANSLTVQEIPSVTAAFPEWAESAKQQIFEVMQFGQSGLFTKFKDGPLTLKNLFQNLEAIAATPGLNRLGNSLKGVPAIIVAAGPSLKKNVDTLREAGDDFLLIASDTAFELLLRRGIVPHMVVTVDPTELNLKHFPREQYREETILLFDPEARPEIVAKFPLRMTFLTDKHPFFGWLDRQLGGKGIVPKGNMVSQAGLYAARFLGCDPLILVGQDLALDPETGHTHNPETAYCRQARFLESDRQHIDIPIPAGERESTRENLFWVEGVDGKPVPTVQNFLVYLRMLEKDIRDYRLRLIDATEGGAKIQGSQIAALADVLESCRTGTGGVSNRLAAVKEEGNRNAPSPAQHIQKSLKNVLRSRIDLAADGLKRLANNPGMSLASLERAIDTFSERIFANPAAEYPIEYGAPRELFEFMKLGPTTLSEEEERKLAQKRLRILLESVSQAAERLMDYL